MSQPSGTRPTLADIDLVAADHVADLIRGALQSRSRPRPSHARAAGNLFRRIAGAFDDGKNGPGGWWIMLEPAVHDAGHVIVPTLAGWRRERMPTLPDSEFYPIAPDWVCEVVSPSVEGLDRDDKMSAHGKLNVGHVWLVDAEARTLEIYVNEHHVMRQLGSTCEEHDVVKAPPFDAIEIDLSTWWG